MTIWGILENSLNLTKQSIAHTCETSVNLPMINKYNRNNNKM
jgi:hypothetical protein